MLVYLMRHGETVWNREQRMQGSQDVPLNENGRRLAEEAAEGMKDIPFDRIIASSLSRAQETAQAVSRRVGVPVETDSRIIEMSFGAMEGKSGDETPLFHTFFCHPEQYVPDGGETFEELDARCVPFLRDLAADRTHRCVLVVAHGAVNNNIMRLIRRDTVANFWREKPQPNCSVHILSVEDGQWKILEQDRCFFTSEPHV